MTTKTFLKAAIASAVTAFSFAASAQTFTATAPTPAPDTSAQQALSTAANTNGTSTYNAGVAYYDQQAYEAAAQTAQNISDQDAANVGSGYGGGMGYSDVWQQAATQAQGVADQSQAQADNQVPIQQQSEASQTNSAQTETAAAPTVASANSTAAQSASNSGSGQSFADISAQTGVPQGQVTVSNDTAEYLVAGAATQALMNGVSTDGYQANIAAYQAAQNAASCGNPGCAAAWWAVNASQQARANADYAANTAAAPVLGSALNVAAAASAVNSATQTLQQIQSMTGVSQGQTAGATSAQQAQALTTAGTGVAQGQPQVGTDTSYTAAADTQQADLGAATQQNQDAAVTAAQAWQTGLSALYSRNAAQNIAAYDNTMAQTTGDPDWTSAAQIAQQQVDQQGAAYDAQSVIQNQAIATGNSSGAAANAMAPGIGNTLNTAASSSATSQAQATLQGIAAQTGVPQNQ